MHKACLFTTLVTAVFAVTAKAQKFPAKQDQSVAAPKNVKVDGRAVEWGRLQAYNPSTQLYYTVANTGTHLYIVLKATDRDAVKKILVGGVTVTINHSGKTADPENRSITFPLLQTAEVSSIAIKYNESVYDQDSLKMGNRIDSLVRLMNADINSKAKEIRLSGIRQVTDSLLSVYNDNDVKAAVRFDDERNLVIEFGMPLTYWGLYTPGEKFNYNITLNGVGMQHIYTPPTGGRVVMVVSQPHGLFMGGGMGAAYPTDFWGEYTLKQQ